LTSLREAIRRRLRLPASGQREDPVVSYRLFWTGQARTWTAERRQAVLRAIEEVLATPGFEPNPYERRYRLAPLDSSGHAGASLVALQEALTALDRFDEQERTPDPKSDSQGEPDERQHPDRDVG
jgi:hypothetical protein